MKKLALSTLLAVGSLGSHDAAAQPSKDPRIAGRSAKVSDKVAAVTKGIDYDAEIALLDKRLAEMKAKNGTYVLDGKTGNRWEDYADLGELSDIALKKGLFAFLKAHPQYNALHFVDLKWPGRHTKGYVLANDREVPIIIIKFFSEGDRYTTTFDIHSDAYYQALKDHNRGVRDANKPLPDENFAIEVKPNYFDHDVQVGVAEVLAKVQLLLEKYGRK